MLLCNLRQPRPPDPSHVDQYQPDGQKGGKGHVLLMVNWGIPVHRSEPFNYTGNIPLCRDSVGVTNLGVILLHAEQKLLQFLQQKGNICWGHIAHELLKMQLCYLCTVCAQHHHNEEEVVIIQHQNWQGGNRLTGSSVLQVSFVSIQSVLLLFFTKEVIITVPNRGKHIVFGFRIST